MSPRPAHKGEEPSAEEPDEEVLVQLRVGGEPDVGVAPDGLGLLTPLPDVVVR